MIENLVIGEIQEKNWRDVEWLYFNGFSEIFRDRIKKNFKYVKSHKFIVAKIGENVVGFGSYCFGRDDLDLSTHSFSEIIAVHNNDKDRINMRLGDYVSGIGYSGEISAELYDNDATRYLCGKILADIIISGRDFYLTDMVVSPHFQRRGIGKRLAEERIKIAQETGSKIAYVSCIEGRYSLAVYEKLGFSPVIRLKPGYPDGSAAIRLIKIL